MSKKGRPTTYSEDVADKIFIQMVSGESINKICKCKSMPDKSTFFRWLRKYSDFRDRYEIAASERSDALVEDMLDIAENQVGNPVLNDDGTLLLTDDGETLKVIDGPSVQHARLRVDTRKWAASKLKPKKYGDTSTLKVEDNRTESKTEEELLERMAAINLEMDKRNKVAE